MFQKYVLTIRFYNVDEYECIEDCLDEIMNSNRRYDYEWEYA